MNSYEAAENTNLGRIEIGIKSLGKQTQEIDRESVGQAARRKIMEVTALNKPRTGTLNMNSVQHTTESVALDTDK